MRTRILAIGTVLVTAAALILTSGPGGDEAVAAELESFSDCPALLDRLVGEASDEVGPYGLEGNGGPIFLEDRAVAGEAAGATDGGAPVPAPGGDTGAEAPQAETGYTSETGTNVQVVGVDEPDHVKLAADVLAVIDGDGIALIDVSGTTPRRVGRITLGDEMYPNTMLVSGSRLVVFGYPVQETPVPMPLDGDGRGTADGELVEPGFYYRPPGTDVAVYDVADPAAPSLVDRMHVGGDMVSSRLTAGRVLLITSSSPSIPFVYPSGESGSEARATEANRQVLAESTIDQWIAQVTFADGTSRPLSDCTRVGVPSDIGSWQSIGIASFDPTEPLAEVSAAATFGAGWNVYSSGDRTYVAGQNWTGETVTTPIHAFATNGDPAYLASGEVEGSLLNQYSMDRFEGYLRVATTRQASGSGESDSAVVVLAERDSTLEQVGSVTGLGRGETIHAVRFLGPIGFVVTFRQTDPLYALDLSDPAAPSVEGELKIPGYSAYLHPVGDGRLLGIGRTATDEGQITGLQVSLFDVADLTTPTQLSVLEVPDAGTPVEWDPHAFTWASADGLAVIPYEIYGPMGVAGSVEPDMGGETGAPASEPVDPATDGAGEAGSSGASTPAAPPDEQVAELPSDEPPPDEPRPVEPAMPPVPSDYSAGLLLVQVRDGQVAEVARVEGPRQDGWPSGFQRSLVHDGTLLAVGQAEVWRIGMDGEILAKAPLR